MAVALIVLGGVFAWLGVVAFAWALCCAASRADALMEHASETENASSDEAPVALPPVA
jgi:hypothetical protein